MINWWNFRFSEIEMTLLWICEMRFKLSGKGDNNKWHTCFTFSCMCFSIFTVMPMSFPTLSGDERRLKGRKMVEMVEKWKFHFIIVFLALLHTDRATNTPHWQLLECCSMLLGSMSATAPHPAMTWRFGFIALVVCTHFPLLVLTFSAEFNWQVVWKVLDISLQLHKKDILKFIDDISEAISPFSYSWQFFPFLFSGERSKNRTKFDGKIGKFPKQTEEIVKRKRKRKMKLLKVFIFILFPSLSWPY